MAIRACRFFLVLLFWVEGRVCVPFCGAAVDDRLGLWVGSGCRGRVYWCSPHLE